MLTLWLDGLPEHSGEMVRETSRLGNDKLEGILDIFLVDVEEGAIIKLDEHTLESYFSKFLYLAFYLMLSFEFGSDFDDSIVSLDLHVRIVVVISLDITVETNGNVVRVNGDFNASGCLKDFSI